MSSSARSAPPMVLLRLRADSWPPGVRSRMYSRSVPDVAGQRGEDDAGGVARAVQLPGKELRADVACLQFLGERGEFDAAAAAWITD